MFRSALPFAEAAGLVDPLVCYQGGLVAEPGGRILHHRPVPLELAREALAQAAELGFAANAYVGDELYVARHGPETDAYLRAQGVPIPVHEVGDLHAWLAEPPTKLVAVAAPERLAELERPARERFAGRLYVARSLPHFLEYTHPRATKRDGLSFLGRHLGFARERTVAFGDGENDLELLRFAGYGVAVANAHPDVLGEADLVCPAVDEEGVAQVVEALLDLA
jgi:Cof subfamily protein (haloacid dehalogenase superfamily)